MDGRPASADSKHHYQALPWTRVSSNSSTPKTTPASAADSATSTQFPTTHFDLLPILFPHQSSLYQAQLLQYNKLVAPDRGGGGGLQTAPLPPVLSSPHIQAGTRSRSSSKVSNKDHPHATQGTQNCHGNRGPNNSDKADRAVITKGKEAPPKMSGKKQSDASHPVPSRAGQHSAKGTGHPPAHSNSVPSTPHQHARKFSFESREPSPNATQNHSPRSAYSETNSTLPSLRPLPPRLGGCKYETGLSHSRRRMPYSLGSDRLETVDPDKIKSKLSEDEERKLTTDMRELYDRLLPTADIEKNRQKLGAKLKRIFNEEWPGHDIEVHLFGSSGNLLCSDDSDVDICITTAWKELEGVCMIAELLAKHGMQKVVCVSSAKVPIVKIWDPELGLACDMNVNNTLALENTRMVRTYVEIDERVRPLAMIIKYWTRRRIVNDAAFGGTLSSYTWICMIIIFLQLRDPPILPALHRRLDQRLPAQDGKRSAFADDLDKLRGFGVKNKDSLGALLFQFFRFYAHEFDYDKFILSLRAGKMLTKTEKKWHLTLNNMLCVEEPFNTARNLGNTADDTSFRGLHLELRRAFDLIAEGKLEECCEQYVFPKEEERIWQKPPPAPRPILVRNSSQQHSGRGGRGGFRGGRGFHRNANGNRRASSSVAAENSNNGAFAPGGLPAALATQDPNGLWYHPQPQQLTLTPDLFGNAISALQLQEHNLRFQLFTQSQAAIAQQQALAHAHQMQSAAGRSSQPSDRSRTNSLDNPPLTAPLRGPDSMTYLYGFPMQPAPFFAQPPFTTYPSSPSTTSAVPEFRRSLHRATVTGDSGASTGSASLRSQSQPASRTSLPSGQAIPSNFPAPSGLANNFAPPFAPRQVNGVPIPSFIPDENADSELDEGPAKAMSESPPEEDGPQYIGYYVSETSSPVRKPNHLANGFPAFGDLGLGQTSQQGRRRLSTDQLPQSILDRRMRRTSRSPSPLGHVRAFSVGTSSAPLSSAPFPPSANHKLMPPTRPLVVNGSATKSGSATGSSRQPSASESMASEDSGYDNPLHIQQGPPTNGPWTDQSILQTPLSAEPSPAFPERPVIVNGSTQPVPMGPKGGADGGSFGHRMVSMNAYHGMPYAAVAGEGANPVPASSPNRPRAASRSQPNGIVPLDLAVSEFGATAELQHLSPVYETRTPSPTAIRKFDTQPSHEKTMPPPTGGQVMTGPSSDHRTEPAASKTNQKAPVALQIQTKPEIAPAPLANSRVNGVSNRANGHAHGPRPEGDGPNPGGWQKQKSRKKTNDAKHAANGYPLSEQLPKNDADRKGG